MRALGTLSQSVRPRNCFRQKRLLISSAHSRIHRAENPFLCTICHLYWLLNKNAHYCTLCTLVQSRLLTSLLFAAAGTFICYLYSVLFLKLWSYVQVNCWCRQHLFANVYANSSVSSGVPYSLGNFLGQKVKSDIGIVSTGADLTRQLPRRKSTPFRRNLLN